MELTVRLFGPLAQAAQCRVVTVDCAGSSPTVACLGRLLLEREPALAPMMNLSRFAVNNEFAPEDRLLGPDDEIALIGLVSGG
jgi:molybdopterin converting factor small subunit